jgi:UDP-glucose 4-epimerase
VNDVAHLVTGGAGFIAFTLIERLLGAGARVVAVDNLARGRREFLEAFKGQDRFAFHELDVSDAAALTAVVEGEQAGAPIEHIWHLAANSDIPGGIVDPRIDLKDTFMTTFQVCQVARAFGIANVHFASSSAIYGDLGDVAIHEDMGPLQPISNYGAMKLASEAQLRAAVEAFLPRADIFRFPNVIGVPATHGVIFDFVHKLKATPERLDVLGNGSQRKPYLHVEDLVDAMIFIGGAATERYNVFNIGPRDVGVTVKAIAEAVRDAISSAAEIAYGEDKQGWVGDVPRFSYNTNRLRALGWTPRLDSHAAMIKAVAQIGDQAARSGWRS